MSNSTRMIGLRLTGVLVVAVAASFSLLVLGTISVKASPQTVAPTYVVTRYEVAHFVELPLVQH